MIQTLIKVLAFVGLVAGFIWFSEVTFESQTRAARRAEAKVICMFIGGAGIALWGDKRVGVLDLISLRGLFVVLGVLLMIFSLMLASGLKKNRDPNQPAAVPGTPRAHNSE